VDDKFLEAKVALHCKRVPFDVQVLILFEREIAFLTHVFVDCRQNGNEVVQQEDVRNEDMDRGQDSVAGLLRIVIRNNVVAETPKH